MFLQINMEKYNQGKNRIKKGFKDFEVREVFWEKLINFAEDDIVSYVKENATLINTHKTEQFISFITDIARTNEELEIVDDLQYCRWGTGVAIRNTYVSSSIIKTVANIEDDYAVFYSMKTREAFKVKIADRILGKVKVGDEVIINILMNGNWVVAEVVE